MSAGPLDGLTVLEVSSFVAAPLGGLTLAQLGADVIRVDPVGGAADQGRWPLAPSGTSLFWTGLNKGKRSVTVNFRQPEGRQIVADLVRASGPGGGIVLTNAVGQALAGLPRAGQAPPGPDPPADPWPPGRPRRRRLHRQRRDWISPGHRA